MPRPHTWRAASWTVLAIGIACAATTAAPAADRSSTGFWSGTIEVPDRPLEVMVELEEAADGWDASLYIPSQGVRGAALERVVIDGAAVGFSIPGMPGEPRFEGRISGDGTTIGGTYTQAGRTFPFQLTRGAKPAELEVDIYAAFRERTATGTGLAGTWRSILEAGPHRYRLVLVIEDRGEGAFGATLQNLDRGPSDPQPVAGVALSGDAVTLDLGNGGTVEGTLSDDGAGITGRFRQQGIELDMTLWRAG